MFNRQKALQTLSAAGHEISALPQATTPNYKMSAAASTVLGVLWAVSNLEGCGSVASKIALVGALLSAGAAVNQFGVTKAQLLVSTTWNSFWNKDAKPAAAHVEQPAEEFHEAATEVDEKLKMQ